MPVEDRLAEPVLPESPTQVDIGRYLYYFHCMPCHGDRGQGLTDEFREIWVEDHQNCWGRGCHTGRSELAAFHIPRSIPAVIDSPQALGAFETAGDLFSFLRATQPPQRPGALADSEYWALTSFLLHENGRPLPAAGSSLTVSGAGLALATLAPLLALLTVTWLARRPARPASQHEGIEAE
jgi:cytochrome c